MTLTPLIYETFKLQFMLDSADSSINNLGLSFDPKRGLNIDDLRGFIEAFNKVNPDLEAYYDADKMIKLAQERACRIF